MAVEIPGRAPVALNAAARRCVRTAATATTGPSVPASTGRSGRAADRATRGVGTLRGVISAIVAHQGGWDEMLLVAVPIVVVGWLLWLAKRRMTRAAQRHTETDD
jgi:hypothetical protein